LGRSLLVLNWRISSRTLQMKLQRTTWILVALASILGGFVYFYEIQGASKREMAEVQKKALFDFQEDDIQHLRIERAGQTLVFERAEDDTSPWRMKQPENELASEPSIEFLLNLLMEKERDRAFSVSPEQLKSYGLEPPLATIAIEQQGKEGVRKLVLGKPNFDEKLLYAQIDPPKELPEKVELVLVPIDFKYAVERKLEEWKQEKEEKTEEGKTEEKE